MRLLDGDEVLRERIVEQVLSDLIDYRGMSAAERIHVRRVIPFYGWLRGISAWTLDLGYNHPEELLGLAMASTIGQDENADWNAATPGFMHGAIRIGNEQDGIQRIVNTQGLNPLSTIADMASLTKGLLTDNPAQSLAGGTAVGQLNPFARTLAQATLNKGNDFATGYPMMMPGQTLNQEQPRTLWPSWPGAALGGFIASTPQGVLYANAKAQGINQAQGAGSVVSTSGVYRSPLSDYLLTYLGLPLRNVDTAGAADRQQREMDLLAGVA